MRYKVFYLAGFVNNCTMRISSAAVDSFTNTIYPNIFFIFKFFVKINAEFEIKNDLLSDVKRFFLFFDFSPKSTFIVASEGIDISC